MGKAALFVRPPTDAERQALEDGLRAPDALARRHARIVLASAAGEHSGQIARRLGCTTQEVREVIRAFNARGRDVVRPDSYHPGGAGTSPDPEDARKKARRDHLLRLAQEHPDWRLGVEDEVGRSQLAPPALHSGRDDDHALPLSDQTVARDDSECETQPWRVRLTHAPRDGLRGPPPRVRRRTTVAVAAAVVLLLVLLAAVTAHVLTTPVHRPAVAPAILSRPPTVPSPASVPARDGAPTAVLQATKPVATPTHIPRRIVPTAPQQQPRAPTVLVNPPELRFGHQRLHVASAAQTVYVINLEPTALRITGVAIAGGHAVSAFAASTVCAGAPIPAYDRCAISVRFRPSTSGTYSASLIIASTAAGSPQRVALSGVGSMVAPGPVARPLSRRLSPSIPSIRRFTLVHPHQGQPYELVWQARDATSLTLNGRPVSAHGIVVLHAPLHSVTYQLVARNGSRRATADLPVVVDARSTNPHAVVLATPDIATFAVRRRQGKLYVTWLVRHAVHVQLQGQSVASAGARPVPPGTSWLRLVASNDVGSRQGLLHLARPVPLARARTRPAPAPTAHPSRMLAARPTAMPTARRTRTPTPYPMAVFTPQPTSRPTTKLGATGGQAR